MSFIEEKAAYLDMIQGSMKQIITEADSLYIIVKRIVAGKTEFVKVPVGSSGQTVSLVSGNIVTGDAAADKIIATETQKLQPTQVAAKPAVSGQPIQ